MVAVNESDEDNEYDQIDAIFEEKDRNQGDQDSFDMEENQEDQNSDQEDLQFIIQDGNPSPAEIKMKIKKVLLEFRCRIEDAILGNFLLGKSNKKIESKESFKAKEELREITLWGIPLLPSKGHEGTDFVLMKFLKAKDFRVRDAFDMLKKTLKWRIDNKIDGILDEDLDSESDFAKAVYLKSRDKEGRPLCFNVYGTFRDRQLYKRAFGTEEKSDKFLRWRIQLIEKAITKLSYKEGGVDSIIDIIDLKNAPRHGMRELNSVNKKVLILIQNYYPELIHRNIVINAPFWFYTSQVLFSRFMNQRSKKKFIFARPPRATQTLLKFINPERLPVDYGGLRRDKDEDFSSVDQVSELAMKGSTVSRIEFPVTEPGLTVIWDVTVVGWEVSYKEEFIPDDEGSYNVLLENQKRMGDSVRNSFYISEPGKIVLTIENGTYKTKRTFYRSKAIPTVPMYIILK